jgi:hypothetical protein
MSLVMWNLHCNYFAHIKERPSWNSLLNQWPGRPLSIGRIDCLIINYCSLVYICYIIVAFLRKLLCRFHQLNKFCS